MRSTGYDIFIYTHTSASSRDGQPANQIGPSGLAPRWRHSVRVYCLNPRLATWNVTTDDDEKRENERIKERTRRRRIKIKSKVKTKKLRREVLWTLNSAGSPNVNVSWTWPGSSIYARRRKERKKDDKDREEKEEEPINKKKKKKTQENRKEKEGKDLTI